MPDTKSHLRQVFPPTMPTPFLDEEEQLFEAVKAGREDKVRALLTCGCRVEAVDKDGKTALHWACQYGHLAILCLLLSYAPGSTFTPSAASLGVQPRACTCYAAGGVARADPGRGPGNLTAGNSVRNLEDETAPLSSERSEDVLNRNCGDKSESGVGGGSIGGVRTLVQRTLADTRNGNCTCGAAGRMAAHVINARDSKGHTPLHVACNYRRADLASFLVTLPVCDINSTDDAGNTPLHRAIHADLDNLACLLCEAGADVRAANKQLRTPLHEAIRSGSENVIRTLLARGCDVNAVTSTVSATTPFLTAIFYYKISVRSSEYGRSLDTILRLLIEAGCRLSQGDCQWTPLSATIDIDKSFVASLLLFNGCRFQRSYTSRAYSRSLLVEAFTRCEAYVVKLLVLCGYQPTLDEVDQCSRRIPSFSPLFYRISGSERAAMRTKNELLDWLRVRAGSAPSLMELSRTSVRLALNSATDDTSILKRIQGLPVPALMRRYVSLGDFAENLLL